MPKLSRCLLVTYFTMSYRILESPLQYRTWIIAGSTFPTGKISFEQSTKKGNSYVPANAHATSTTMVSSKNYTKFLATDHTAIAGSVRYPLGWGRRAALSWCGRRTTGRGIHRRVEINWFSIFYPRKYYFSVHFSRYLSLQVHMTRDWALLLYL